MNIIKDKTRRNRFITIVACIVLFFASIFSVALSVHEAHHECIGNDCPICLVVKQVKETQAKVEPIKPLVVLPVITFVIFAFKVTTEDETKTNKETLITTQIRLNN